MTMDFNHLNYVTSTKVKKVSDKKVKPVSHLTLKISFITLFGCLGKITLDINPMVRWIGLVLMTPNTWEIHRQSDKQINRLKEYM